MKPKEQEEIRLGLKNNITGFRNNKNQLKEVTYENQ